MRGYLVGDLFLSYEDIITIPTTYFDRWNVLDVFDTGLPWESKESLSREELDFFEDVHYLCEVRRWEISGGLNWCAYPCDNSRVVDPDMISVTTPMLSHRLIATCTSQLSAENKNDEYNVDVQNDLNGTYFTGTCYCIFFVKFSL